MPDKFNKNPWNNEDNKKEKKQVNDDINNDNDAIVDDNAIVKVVSIKMDITNTIFIIMLLWLMCGFCKINTNQKGVVLYFGKFYKIINPGLNYMLPAPIGKLYRVPVTNINKEEFGFRTKDKTQININNESLMLTGDENIVDIDFEVQWRINDVKNYLFSIQKNRLTIRMAAESAMREIIAKRKIDDALAGKKSDIEYEAKELLQEILDSYASGIEIVLVQLLRVDPPSEVIDAFRDVQTAKADKERMINEAETYRNDILPKTRGEVVEILKQAEAYKESIISKAEGESSRFLKIYEAYLKNPALTKKRIYLDSIETVMKDIDKIFIDKKLSNSLLKHLNIDSGNSYEK